MHSINFTLLLSGSRCYQCKEWMLLMAGLSLCRRYHLLSVTKRSLLNMTLSRPGTMQSQHLEILIIHIQACAVNLFDFKLLSSFIQ